MPLVCIVIYAEYVHLHRDIIASGILLQLAANAAEYQRNTLLKLTIHGELVLHVPWMRSTYPIRRDANKTENKNKRLKVSHGTRVQLNIDGDSIPRHEYKLVNVNALTV